MLRIRYFLGVDVISFSLKKIIKDLEYLQTINNFSHDNNLEKFKNCHRLFKRPFRVLHNKFLKMASEFFVVKIV